MAEAQATTHEQDAFTVLCQACHHIGIHAIWCPHFGRLEHMSGIQYPCPGRCGKLTPGGRCAECKAAGEKARDERRGKTAERGYDGQWRKLRELKLRTDPLCQIQTHCTDALAFEVDHRISISRRPELRLDWENLQSTCRACHVAKTKRENARESSAIRSGNTVESAGRRVA